MKIGLYGRETENNLSEYVQQLILILKSHNIELFIYEPFCKHLKESYRNQHLADSIYNDIPFFNSYEDIKRKIDFLFSIGGDGTLLNTISLIRDSGIPIAGINTGRLGFLSSISKEEFSTALDKIISGNYVIDNRTLIKLVTETDLFGKDNFALNEFTVQKYETSSMIHIYASVNNDFLNSYWADGLIIATPTGSTAYSLSCGGPIVAPDSQNFVITPIAPHNLNVCPLVISDSSVINLKIKSNTQHILIGLDSRSEIIDASLELVISKQNFNINLIRIPESNFFSTIRNKLMWGLDVRN